MSTDLVIIDATELSGTQRKQLSMILGRAAAAPSIDPPVADQLTRAAAAARLLVPEDLRLAEMRRRLDNTLRPDGRMRETWRG